MIVHFLSWQCWRQQSNTQCQGIHSARCPFWSTTPLPLSTLPPLSLHPMESIFVPVPPLSVHVRVNNRHQRLRVGCENVSVEFLFFCAETKKTKKELREKQHV